MSGKKTEIYKIVKYIVQYVHQNKKEKKYGDTNQPALSGARYADRQLQVTFSQDG